MLTAPLLRRSRSCSPTPALPLQLLFSLVGKEQGVERNTGLRAIAAYSVKRGFRLPKAGKEESPSLEDA